MQNLDVTSEFGGITCKKCLEPGRGTAKFPNLDAFFRFLNLLGHRLAFWFGGIFRCEGLAGGGGEELWMGGPCLKAWKKMKIKQSLPCPERT